MRRTSLAFGLLAATAAIASGSLTAARAGGAPVALVTAETENALLGAQLARQRVVPRSADGAEQDGIGRLRERQCRVGQRMTGRIVPAPAVSSSCASAAVVQLRTRASARSCR